MYLINRNPSFGQAPSATSTTYVDRITSLQTSANAKDWPALITAITNILSDPNLAQNAGSLIPKLNDLQNNANKMISNPGTDLSSNVISAINDLMGQAQVEASATPDERLMSQEFLSQRIFDLDNAIGNFQGSFTGWSGSYTLLVGKITGKLAEGIIPLKNQITEIAQEIATTPLTQSGRQNLLAQLAAEQQSINDSTNLINSSIAKLGLYFIAFIGGTAALAWIKAKAREHSIKHAKRLHRRYVKGLSREDIAKLEAEESKRKRKKKK